MRSLWMLVASLLFACMGVCVKLGAGRFSYGELVFFRGFIALLLVSAWIRLIGGTVATAHWRNHLWRGTSGFVALALYFYALGRLPLATAITLNYTSPLFLALLLALWSRERVGGVAFAGLAVGLLGVALLLQPVVDRSNAMPALMGLASGAIAGIAFLNVRVLGRLGEPEWRVVFYFSLAITVGALPWVLAGGVSRHIDAEDMALLLGVGGFGAAAQLAMTRAYRYGATLVAASLAYAAVVFAGLFDLALWNIALTASSWIGIALIAASGAVVSASAARQRAAP